MNPSRVRWGVLLVLVGLVFLAVNLDMLSWWIWLDLLRFWPLLLIVIGLEVIVKKSKLQVFGYLSTLIIIVAFVWVIVENGGFDGDDYGSFPSSRSEATVAYSNETNASINLKVADGRLYFNSGDDHLVRATAENSRNGIRLSSDCVSGGCRVTISPSHRRLPRIVTFGSRENHWKCYLHPDVATSYNLDLENVDLRFFAQELKVDTLRIDASGSDLVIRLGKRQSRSCLIVTGSDSNVDIYIPDSTGIRLEGDYPRRSEIDALKLTDRGGYLANDLYSIAATEVQIKSEVSEGRVRVSSY